jgi:hypothetical protein
MSQKNLPEPPENQSDGKWWQFGPTTWMLVGGLLLLNVGCFLQPNLLDLVFAGLGNLLDFRLWPWWYFLCLILVLGFSVRWFLLLQARINDDLDSQGLEEAKWFCWLSGTITGLSVLLILLHQTGMMRRMYRTLNLMFGYGHFSIWALLIFAGIFGIIGLLVFLTGKWISSIQTD